MYKEKLMKDFEKFCFKVTMKFGDLYYEKMNVEEAYQKAMRHIKDPAMMCTS
jgi:hypothetical protein